MRAPFTAKKSRRSSGGAVGMGEGGGASFIEGEGAMAGSAVVVGRDDGSIASPKAQVCWRQKNKPARVMATRRARDAARPCRRLIVAYPYEPQGAAPLPGAPTLFVTYASQRGKKYGFVCREFF